MIVTRDNFARAETDFHFTQAVRGGGFGRLVPRREMVPVNRQGVVRMNRDTLYSAGVFDLAAAPVTITLPDPRRRYMSLQVISEDQYTPLVAYAPGRYVIDEAQAGTRAGYEFCGHRAAAVIFRLSVRVGCGRVVLSPGTQAYR